MRKFLSCSFAKSSARIVSGFGSRAAEDARMQILGGSNECDLVIAEPAQAVRNRRDASLEHRSIRDDQRVGFELGLVLGDVVPETLAADFFFSLDQHFDVDGKLARGLLERIERANVDVDLPFIVGGAAAE